MTTIRAGTKNATKALSEMTPAELEKQANLLLFGTAKEPRSDAIARQNNTENFSRYFKPKQTVKCRKDNGQPLTCSQCGRLRHALSTRYCRPCYLGIARMRRIKLGKGDAPIEMPEMAFENGDVVPVYRDYEEEEAA